VDFADGGSAATDNILGVVLQYGILGVAAIILFLVAKRLFDREQARADRLEADVRRLNDLMVDQMVPALTKSTEAVANAVRILEEIRRQKDIEDAARKLRGE
jgi:hypothetical protein